MMIRITDQGIPFNPLEKDEPDISLPVDERNIGGLGIFMVRNLVDDLSYHRDDHQNILTIIKQLHE
jgi:anti-sigma regulatory factor (Ser/Thr protein kinase)